MGQLRENIGPVGQQLFKAGDSVIELAELWKPTSSLKNKDYRAIKKYLTKENTTADLNAQQKILLEEEMD